VDKRLRQRQHAVWVALVAGLPVLTAGAESLARSQLVITARVAAVARIEQLQQPVVVTVTQEDAARGDVTARARLHVLSNALDGYVLTLWPRAAWFESVQLAGAGATADLPGDGGAIVRPSQGAAIDDISLTLTFRLRGGTPAGTYAWPVEFAVSPL
jgi:hypothetical protein